MNRTVAVELTSVATAIALCVSVLAGAGRADVYEWHDAEGRHFSDSLEAIPQDHRADATMIIKEPPAAPAAAAPTPAAETAEQPAESPTFASGWDSGFEAGYAAGFEAASNQQPECPAQPEVIVLQSTPPPVVTVPRYDGIGGYYQSPYAGTVTAPFDGGRSFGLTRREQMQRLQGR